MVRGTLHLLHVLGYTWRKKRENKNLSLKILNAFVTDKEEDKKKLEKTLRKIT